MNERDNQANTRAIDSLLNFETVKYFGNEEHEARRFDRAMAGYEDASVKSQTSLALLSIGQGVLVAVGLTLVMYLAGLGIADGRMTVGDFVMVNTYLMQLYQPLNFFGFVYREIKQGLIDIEKMFELLRVEADIGDVPQAPPLRLKRGRGSLRGCILRLRGATSHLRAPESGYTRRERRWRWSGPRARGKSTLARLLYRFYDVDGGAIRIDGQDLRGVSQSSLRAAIGVWCRRTPCCSTTASTTTSRTDVRTPPRRKSRTRRGWPTSTTSSRACRTAIRRSSASAASSSPGGERSSGSPSRAPCSRIRAC